MATEEDKVNNGALATLVAVLTFGVLGIILAVTALTRDQMSEEFASKDRGLDHEYRQLSTQQAEKLSVGVPIEQAMQQVVAELARNPGSATPPSSASAAAPSPPTAGAGGVGGADGGSGGGSGGASAAPVGAAPVGGAAGAGTRSPGGAPQGAERLKAQGADRLPNGATGPSPGARSGLPGATNGNAETAVPPNGQ